MQEMGENVVELKKKRANHLTERSSVLCLRDAGEVWTELVPYSLLHCFFESQVQLSPSVSEC